MKYRVALFLFFFLATTQGVLAQSSETYTVKVFGAGETNPPTTPTLVSADPIASTQIDITWSASTDDTLLSGYSILRDGTPIATTTLLSYSDTGLVASTTYSYVVRAFDLFFNYSTTSNPLATTTPALLVVPPIATSTEPTSGRGGTASRVVAESITVESGVSTTSLSVVTKHLARLEVRWGRTVSYELGYVVSSVFSRQHEILLTDLEPGTLYEYEIVGYTSFGAETVLRRSTFTTKEDIGHQEVLNVQEFWALGVGDDVQLTWKLPTTEQGLPVRIVRSHLRFPEHLQDGAIVYQGVKDSVVDVGILHRYSPVYYTAFVFDEFGNVSSGAVAIVYAIGVGGEGIPGHQIGTPLTEEHEATSSIVTGRYAVEMKMPQLSDILVQQGATTVRFTDAPILLKAARSFTVSVPRSAVAGNLKSIIATITNPAAPEKKYSFLLRINPDQTAYTAQLAPLFVDGQSLLVLEIYDYETFVVGTYQTPVIFVDVSAAATNSVVFPDMLFRWLPLLALILGILIVWLSRSPTPQEAN